jgi:hypothetical protein
MLKKNRSRWSRTKSQIRANWKFYALVAIFLISMIITLQISQFFGAIAATKESMINALIQAEATILGFFGLIVIYALTSFDNRTDRLEEQLFKLTTEEHLNMKKEMLEREITRLKSYLSIIRTNKKDLVNNTFGNGILLVSSLVLSILSLAQVQFGSSLCAGAIYFLLFGIVGIFVILRSLAQNSYSFFITY